MNSFNGDIQMTAKEKAREEKQLKYIEYLVKENKDLQHRLDVAQGFLDRDVEYIEMCRVVKARWHDLRKSPDDLPTLDGMYWTYNECGYYDIHAWIPQLWEECKIIAWCELPKFEE